MRWNYGAQFHQVSLIPLNSVKGPMLDYGKRPNTLFLDFNMSGYWSTPLQQRVADAILLPLGSIKLPEHDDSNTQRFDHIIALHFTKTLVDTSLVAIIKG